MVVDERRKGHKLEERRTITIARLQAMRDRAHKLLNQLTAISGYTQIALTGQAGSSIKTELEKVVQAADHASKEVLCCIASLNEVEKEAPFTPKH